MSTTGQFSTKNPTIKRILKEAQEFTTAPSADFTAAPLDTNLFEWHFTLRGPPAPSPYAGGIYHGRIVLPPSYPLRPPSFRFLTPSGRFEVNREICLSISGFHEETWQPAWGLRTAIVAIRSFMDSEAGGAVGGLEADEGVRRRLAESSRAWRCAGCGRGNGEIMEEQERLVKESGGEGRREEVPEELRLGYRDELGQGKKGEAAGKQPETTAKVEADKPSKSKPTGQTAASEEGSVTGRDAAGSAGVMPIRRPQAIPAEIPVRVAPQARSQPQAQLPRSTVDTSWLDKAIIVVAGAMVLLVARLLLL